METLRGVDEKYRYEFNRNSDIIDEHKFIIDLTDEDYLHEESINNAESISVGYRRWRND